jgi:hypothetical protein
MYLHTTDETAEVRGGGADERWKKKEGGRVQRVCVRSGEGWRCV